MSDIDVGAMAEALNDKMDRDAHNVQSPSAIIIEKQDPSASNNYTWYRKYSDGWVEQGGKNINSTQNYAVVLLVPMSDTNYCVSITGFSFGSNYNGAIHNIRADTLTSTGFTIQCRDYNNGNYTTQSTWRVEGIAAS